MSTILLQLESALADARTAQEIAREKLHDTGVAQALAKNQYDAATDVVNRMEGALNALHGVAAAPSAPVIAAATAPREPKKPKPPEGPECPGCGDVGTLAYIMRGTVRFAQCPACKGEYQS